LPQLDSAGLRIEPLLEPAGENFIPERLARRLDADR
jgi:hypothetical protein